MKPQILMIMDCHSKATPPKTLTFKMEKPRIANNTELCEHVEARENTDGYCRTTNTQF